VLIPILFLTWFPASASPAVDGASRCRLTVTRPKPNANVDRLTAGVDVVCRYVASGEPAKQRLIQVYAFLARSDSATGPVQGEARTTVWRPSVARVHVNLEYACGAGRGYAYWWRVYAYAQTHSARGNVGRSSIRGTPIIAVCE
jgi:hypothetical protein